MSRFKAEKIYVSDDGSEIFFSPDGIGRVWFDTLEEAEAETGLPVVHGWNWGEQGYDSFGTYVGDGDVEEYYPEDTVAHLPSSYNGFGDY